MPKGAVARPIHHVGRFPPAESESPLLSERLYHTKYQMGGFTRLNSCYRNIHYLNGMRPCGTKILEL
jgi:hypothetical protein